MWPQSACAGALPAHAQVRFQDDTVTRAHVHPASEEQAKAESPLASAWGSEDVDRPRVQMHGGAPPSLSLTLRQTPLCAGSTARGADPASLRQLALNKHLNVKWGFPVAPEGKASA